MLLTAFLLLTVWRLALPRRRLLDIAVALGLLLCFLPAAGWLLAAAVERRAPITELPQGEADAIVVLGSNHFPSNPSVKLAEPGFVTYIRTAHAAWLYRHWRRIPVLASGGTGAAGDPRVADLMRRQLMLSGVPGDWISVDPNSLNTYQNAVESARLLLPRGIRRIALVTDALHMPRAERAFRKQGFDVVRAACCYRTDERRTLRDLLLPDEWALRVNSLVLHEMAGLVWYKLRGWI
jgi:uncharacterized SAM-binding protein YcdF (DUF218 family)